MIRREFLGDFEWRFEGVDKECGGVVRCRCQSVWPVEVAMAKSAKLVQNAGKLGLTVHMLPKKASHGSIIGGIITKINMKIKLQA